MDLDYDYRKCARYIYDETRTPHFWDDKLIVETVYRIHDRSRYLIWLAEGMEVPIFSLRTGKEIPSVKDYTLAYPRDFVSEDTYPEYSSFLELIHDDEKHGSFWLIAMTLDIYYLTKRLLHNYAINKPVFSIQIVKLKKMCTSVIEAEKHEYKNELGKESSSSTIKDYVSLFDELMPTIPKNYLPFKDARSKLEAKYIASCPFVGNHIRLYFEATICFISRGKGKPFQPIGGRTLENAYVKVKKIHRTKLCEK